MTGNLTSSGSSSSFRSLVLERRMPSVMIGLNGARELPRGRGFLAFKALISFTNTAPCVSLMISCSSFLSSAGVSSPDSLWSSGLRQLAMKRCTQLLTPTNDVPISNSFFDLTFYHLEYLAGFRRHSPFVVPSSS